jgi:hypothetical protein
MRDDVTDERLRALMREIARTAPRGKSYRVYLVGGGTAVLSGWRPTSVDADLFAPDESVFRDIQGIKERLNVNVEFARPEHFVPALSDSDSRHVFIETVDRVSYFHYDPYAQVLSKVVRGFERDIDDARQFIRAGLVDAETFVELVEQIPSSAYAKYPSLSQDAVAQAVEAFVSDLP